MTESPRPEHPAVSAAQAFLQQLREDALVSEAEALAHGLRYLSIAHGHPETDDDMSRLQNFTDHAWPSPATLTQVL